VSAREGEHLVRDKDQSPCAPHLLVGRVIHSMMQILAEWARAQQSEEIVGTCYVMATVR